MGALHRRTSFWLKQGFFDNLTSFEDFETRVNRVPEEKDRGDLFEIFIEGYLATHLLAQCVRHWVVGDIPLSLRERYRLPSDPTGVDGIYQTHDGGHVAYQVKYRQKRGLTFAEVAPFLGITEEFEDRIIFTNVATLSDKAVMRTRWISGDLLRALSLNALSKIEAWLKEKPQPISRATPEQHQLDALSGIRAEFEKSDRATVVMACGTGKTLVSLWAAEAQHPNSVLVLIPSLTLMQQTLREWSEQTKWGPKFNYICVCSDPTVDLKEDALNPERSVVGFRVDTDPAIVTRFLRRDTDDIKVIFSTYQSSPVVGEGSRGLRPIDLAIFDEAHKTIGLAGSAFGFPLSDENLKIKKRLFLTATPKHIDIRHRDKEGEFRVYSMDDASIYGRRAHTLSFASAAQKRIICPYKVIISIIDKAMVDDFTRKQGITLVEKDTVAAQWIANLIALKIAIERVQAKKVITFHTRVRMAKEFATNEPRGIAYHLGGYEVRHVNGIQSSSVRSEIITAFADAPRALLTNARCLTEGVDIPAVDMVAFIDPRRSRIDIAQAVGRAMRKPRNGAKKELGFVVVPLFAEKDTGDLDAVVKSEGFEAAVDVLNALQEHDEELVEIIREIKQRKGEGKAFQPKPLTEKLDVIGPRVTFERLSKSIGVEIADRIGSRWDEWFGLLLKFKEREGHCLVPENYSDEGFNLGNWVRTQRAQRMTKWLLPERRKRLDEIGLIWDVLEHEWEQAFAILKQFKAREGHCRVPRFHLERGFKLGTWVNSQRGRRERGDISAKHVALLNETGFEWSPFQLSWKRGFVALESFKTREGHCRVPRFHLEEKFKLGTWLSNQREQRKKGLLSVEQISLLDGLGVIWDPLESAWQDGRTALQAFKSREGHCDVPSDHIEDGLRLGGWVIRQRRKRSELDATHSDQLNEIGFVWNVRKHEWEVAFALLKKFKEREGHCRVPPHHVEDDLKLGQWVHIQRPRRNTMTAERRRRLDEIGFAWNPREDAWDRGYAALGSFKAREGHCDVPHKHIEGNFKLGKWVNVQRTSRARMPAERVEKLTRIGFIWSALDQKWEKAFSALQIFKSREGHSRVPGSHVEGGFNLGAWVKEQRRSKANGRLSSERINRIEAEDFEWEREPSDDHENASRMRGPQQQMQQRISIKKELKS